LYYDFHHAGAVTGGQTELFFGLGKTGSEIQGGEGNGLNRKPVLQIVGPWRILYRVDRTHPSQLTVSVLAP